MRFLRIWVKLIKEKEFAVYSGQQERWRVGGKEALEKKRLEIRKQENLLSQKIAESH